MPLVARLVAVMLKIEFEFADSRHSKSFEVGDVIDQA